MTRKGTLYHILFWIGLYLFWIIVFQNRAFAFSKTMTVGFCYLLFISANYYFNIYYAVPRFLYRRKYALFALQSVAGIVLASLLRVPVATYLGEHYFAPGKVPPSFSNLFFDSLVNIFIWVIALVAAKLIIDRVRFQKYIDAIEKEKVKNELDFLKAQFNPHFLFNSINSIYGNIDKSNAAARNMLLTFAEMLRYQLYECNTARISLEKEISYIKNYIALQQTRKPENLSVQLDVCGQVGGVMVAPLLFITFIENAFKYVSQYDDELNEVKISMNVGDDVLRFRAFNTTERFNGRKLNDHKGIGIANVKRRLELLYPQKHELKINAKEDFYEVNLNLRQ